MRVGAIIMLGASAATPAEALVLDAQRAATLDLINLLRQHIDCEIVLSSPELTWFPGDIDAHLILDPPDQPFHFGQTLAHLIQEFGYDHIFYFGGGSAPLLDGQIMDMVTGLILNAGPQSRIPSHIVLSNNRYSSDWVAISHVAEAIPIIQATERDNSLAWALQESGLYNVRIPAGFRPATSLDLDTPADLAIVRQHPDCPPHLKAAIQSDRLSDIPFDAVLRQIRREGSQILLAGRVSPQAWEALNKVTRSWLRVYAEERGMVASERLKRGEVRSMLGQLLGLQGAERFFEFMATIADAAIIDTRVLMAHALAELPASSDRFASDLYQPDLIANEWLRDFTQAAQHCEIPILLGGHNVVAGGLYAIAEMVQG